MSKCMVLRAEHDSKHKEDCGIIELVVSDAGVEEDIKIGIEVLLHAYDEIWAQEPDRILHTTADTPPPIDPADDDAKQVWPGGLLGYSVGELREEVERLRRELLDAQNYAMKLQDLVPEKKLRKLWRASLNMTKRDS